MWCELHTMVTYHPVKISDYDVYLCWTQCFWIEFFGDGRLYYISLFLYS